MITTETKLNLNKASYLEERISLPLVGESSNSNGLSDNWIRKSGLSLVDFQKRLESKGISYKSFLSLLESRDSPHPNQTQWQLELYDIFRHLNRNLLKENIKKADIGMFVLPFTNYFIYSLNKNLSSYSIQHINLTKFIQSAENYLFHELRMVSDKVVVLEFHKLKEKLTEKNRAFDLHHYKSSYLTDPTYIFSILNEYPVLARVLTEITIRTIHNVKQIIDRYLKDYCSIQSTFFNQDVELQSISFGLGDSHKNGQTVAILSFAGGERLVYKPRSLAIDEAYQLFLNWINEQGISINLLNLSSLSYEEYGWQEFVSPKECKEEREVQNYYFRMGATIAIFQLLRTSDMHYENIMASGSVPYVIDLETLFSNSVYTNKTVKYPRKELLNTVLSSGVLPTDFIFDTKVDFDPSALAGRPNQTSENMKGWVLVTDEKDELRYRNQNFITSNEGHLVKMNKSIVKPVVYMEEIEKGFQEVYTILLRNKDKLMNIVSTIFENIQCRVILRPTYLYSRFLMSSYHPQFLGNGLDREELLEMLWNICKSENKFFKIVESELFDLINNDVPYFTYRIDGKHLYDSRSHVIPNVLEISSLEMVEDQVALLSDKNMEDQLNLIRRSVYANEIASMDVHEVESLPASKINTAIKYKTTFLKEAESIGDYLVSQVIYDHDDNYASWIGLENHNEKFHLQALDFSLYNGMLGISVFLGQLYYQIPKPIYKETILKNINYLHNTMQNINGEIVNSVFNGIGSFAYGLHYLAAVLQDDHLHELGQVYLSQMTDLKDNETSKKDSAGKEYEGTTLDFVGGHAGIITFAVNLYEKQDNQLALEIATKYAYDLLENIEQHGHPKLLGLAHGTSGIILALEKIGTILEDERFLSLTSRLLQYEEENFNVDSMNWMDLREHVAENTDSYYWCHGAPGILLSRLERHVVDSQVDEKKVIAHFITNHLNMNRIGMCHGVFGNLDILLELSRKYPHDFPNESIIEIAEEFIHRDAIRLRIQGMKDRGLIGLMLGVSGVGYSLLRLHNPNEVPSILTLDIPKIEVHR